MPSPLFMLGVYNKGTNNDISLKEKGILKKTVMETNKRFDCLINVFIVHYCIIRKSRLCLLMR